MFGREIWLLIVALLMLATGARAEMLVAARTIRAQALIGPADLARAEGTMPEAFADPAVVLGQEARVAIYAGRPILAGDIGPPALVERNQTVTLVYRRGALTILAEGRALGRGGAGDSLRAMNIASRTTITGRVAADGTVHVGS
ncbi:flagellar basal body P-ring formation protein FlgA [Frigidibacter albus]|uniref:Flagella basal body P-ring formation protein FlgA n=1 Tax=Frigidibacter albus TaxID=1465486 RepID=A0A6L8VIU5_9RHOB|nr:flagellar basal body P-ring formation chaperone FlgA [Frigidibacter albus]MZQ90307.1 flagellar basal body P-ring formation protein FlgA [Frigidibacter albus]NBE32195.1 flagellar basal body P-ring formation protein FlgA [Frigidibacter albus]GGH58670.1 flagella basal body P-ring formation protein FlgA [Frigidibacter albus]